MIAKLFLFDFVFVLSLKTHQGSMKCLNKIEYAATRQLVKAEVTPFPPLFLFCYNNWISQKIISKKLSFVSKHNSLLS